MKGFEVHSAARLVQALRKQRGLTQAELSEHSGIDTATLSKIENGHAVPKKNTLVTLLEKLNFDTSNAHHLFLSEKEVQHDEIVKQGNHHVQMAEFKAREAQDNTADLRDFLNKLDQNEEFFENVSNKQQYARFLSKLNAYEAQRDVALVKRDALTIKEYRQAKASFEYSALAVASLEKAAKILYDALKLNIPLFELEKVDEYYLTKLERGLIMDLADVYDLKGETDKSIDIYKKLVKDEAGGGTAKTSSYPGMIIHLVITLMYEERYDEAISYASDGIKFCVTYGNTAFLPFLSGVKAYVMCNAYGINEDGTDEEKKIAKEVKELYYYAYNYALVAGDEYLAHECKNNFSAFFHKSIDA